MAHWAQRFEPRRWQVEALGEWRRAMSGIAAVVTGAGKTAFAEMCMLAARDAAPDVRIAIVVPTLALLDQWYVSLQDDLGVSPSEIATYSGEGVPPSPARINLLVINTARSHMASLTSAGQWFLVVDECHRAGSPENAKALDGKFFATLGLSATPEREYDDGFMEYVIPVVGDVIYRYDYSAARHDGVITPFDLVHVQVRMTDEEQRQYDSLTGQIARRIKSLSGEDEAYTDNSVRRLLQRRAAVSASAAIRVPVAARLAETRAERTIVFHERVREADRLLRVLQSRNLSATIYHTGVGAVLRRSNLSLYRTGAFGILVCCRALDEGINVPETSAAIVASSTASTRQRIQRLGRVLRPAPGKSRAIIYTVYASTAEESRLRTESEKLADAATVTWMRATTNA